ncbi:NUDIX domain-containing protein [Romeria aff. gracilis LEGE 07310]|uniref:NUDIX domain-containing protein n=1 Tax=Vasconcelosia minhoensis LEGE 07310 TaxID=915328 RepID=A0A8J7DDN4_9CYAN|nr:NUDIX domain-containing protein [Romeria gracilis]MBE9080062.1 NUDIX domain-containing protein [Romeria aff. gracilis LEGE 07310]
MAKSQRIRPIALGLIEHQGHLFVSSGQDRVTGQTFYRCLGGGIDFGETSQAALAREFLEEIQAALKNIEYLTCIDNIFTLNDKPGHELLQLFRCEFVDSKFYQLDQTFELIEGKHRRKAFWIAIARIRSGELNLVPRACLEYVGCR